MGTAHGGVFVESATGLLQFGTEHGLASNEVLTLSMVNGQLWAGHFPLWDGYWLRGGGASVYEGEHWSAFEYGTPLEASYVNVILPVYGGVLIGTGYPQGSGTIVIKTGDTWDVLDEIAYSEFSCVTCGVIDAFGRIVLGSESDGLLVCSDGTWSKITVEGGLATNCVKAVFSVSSGFTVVSCGEDYDATTGAFVTGGLCLLEDWEVSALPSELVPVESEVTAISFDGADGRFWLGTDSGEVYSYTP